MKTYFSMFRIRMINSLQYRAVALGSIFTRFAWGFMEILAFYALYRTGDHSFSMSFSETVSYYWMANAFYVLFQVNYGDGEIQGAIREGTIAYELVRPLSLYGNWFTQVMANRVAPTLLNCLPMVVLAILMPAPFRLGFPGVPQLLLFLLSTVLALFVVAALALLMHITLFYTTTPRGIKVIVSAVTSFLSGGLIPLTIFPPLFREIAQRLPFAACQSTPLLIYSGTLQGAAIAEAMGLQLFWLVALVALGCWWMHGTLKRVVVLGG